VRDSRQTRKNVKKKRPGWGITVGLKRNPGMSSNKTRLTMRTETSPTGARGEGSPRLAGEISSRKKGQGKRVKIHTRQKSRGAYIGEERRPGRKRGKV